MGIVAYRKGNLVDAFLEGEIDVLAHQCNCFNTMGSGIAREIKQRLPMAYEADQATPYGDVNKLGTYSRASTPGGGLIFNLYGQYNYGREPGKTYTHLAALKQAMLAMGGALGPTPKSIGIPKLGCGLGGALWEAVEPLVQTALAQHHVFVYEL